MPEKQNIKMECADTAMMEEEPGDGGAVPSASEQPRTLKGKWAWKLSEKEVARVEDEEVNELKEKLQWQACEQCRGIT